jgi:fibronectin type 3 domain-containing protein
MKKLLQIAAMVVLVAAQFSVHTAWAAPGQRSVTLAWTEANCPTCTFNVYRGSVTGVCSGTPTPYAKGITTTGFTDTAVTAGQTYFYAVSAVLGVESACSSEAQVAVPSSPAIPSGLSGQTQ